MAELSVSRKNIAKLFSEMRNKKYVIPEYQRPYDWDLEKCETLWNDITSFFEEKSPEQEYFLGTIVSCKNEKNQSEIEVIDGQQRITSLFLLLRAFYSKLEMMSEDIDAEVLDAALIAAAQKVEHYEISSYGTVRAYARLLGDSAAVDLLTLTLEEEVVTDEKLTVLAESGINVDAMETEPA